MNPLTPDYWNRQQPGKLLFPELEWSRPENRQLAGKLAVVGGNLHGFAAPAEAYAEADKAGVGLTRVLLPLAVKRLTGQLFETLEFGASNPSGSFSRQSLSEWLDLAHWSNGVLIAGDLGRNSETAIVFEQFLEKYDGQLTVTKDAIDYVLSGPSSILNRPQTTLVLSMAQLQKLVMYAGLTTPVTLGMDLIRLIDILHNLTGIHDINLVTKYHETIVVVSSGQVSTTHLSADMPIWRVRTAAHTAVWWLQNPQKTYAALTTAITTI